MKIIINTYNRPETISTPALLDAEGIPYTIVFHSQEQMEKYVQAGRINGGTAVVANQPVGMVNIRNWVLENLIKEGEWYLHLDDNITEFQAVRGVEYFADELDTKGNPEYFKKLYDTKISATEFMDIVEETRVMAEKIGANLAGFASNVNFFFRSKKWRPVGYVIGKTQLIRKTSLRYDKNVYATDDYLWTAQNLEAFGKVLINNFAVAIKKHYAKGGIGQYEERLRWKLNDVEYIMKRWPGLYRFKQKRDCHPKAEIQLRFTNSEQVWLWQKYLEHERNKQAKN